MSEQKKKGKHTHETIKPGKGRRDELSEKDLEKAAGGGIAGESTDDKHKDWAD
jgi:hypothetical protein